MTAALVTSWRLAVRLGANPHRGMPMPMPALGDKPVDAVIEIRTPLGKMSWPLVPDGARTQGADKWRTLRRLS